MKKLLYIILISVLMLAVMSCGRSVDKRLVLADTLMWTNPDSSLAILEAINRESLTGDENRAYHALLLTQAQYRNCVTITSDTLIGKAVDYYSNNHNHEHYTRSLLYKGAAYEDMNNPIEAMKWYKQAEDNADTNDYRNLAQINMRMGMLYYNNYASNNLDLEKFKKALFFYDKLHDKRMTSLCHSYLGNLYRINDQQKAQKHYSIAIEQTKEIGDTSEMFETMSSLSLSYYMDGDYEKAKNTALYCINNGVKYINDHCYYYLARAYCALGDADSAKFYLSKAQRNPDDKQMLVIRYLTQKEIAESSGDNLGRKKYEALYNTLHDSLNYNSIKYSLFENEKNFDDNIVSRDNKKISSLHKAIYSLIAILLIFFMAFVLFHFIRKRQYSKLISDLKKDNFAHYEQLGNSINDFDSELSEAMGAKLKVFEEIMTGAYNPQQDYKSNVIAHRMTPIDDKDTKFWNGLFAYLNYKHDGIMDKVSSQFPQLTVPDLNFIALMCCDFSSAAIAVCKGYRNIDSVRSRRMKIRDKMGIEGILTKYIATLKTAN